MNPLSAAQEAIVHATQQAGDSALAPARNLFAARAEPAASRAVEVPTPSVGVAMLEPLTGTTRRAAGLFWNDLRQLSGRTAAPSERP